MGRGDREVSGTGNLEGIKAGKGVGGKEGHKERRRSLPGGCRRTKRRGMVPLSAWARAREAPVGEKSCQVPGQCFSTPRVII